MRIANFWTHFGPSFYDQVDDPGGFAAIEWLLGVCKGSLQCGYVNIPTESKSTMANGFSTARLHKVVDAATAVGLKCIIWADKWQYAAPPDLAWFTSLAAEFPDAILNLGQEVDALWLMHNNPPGLVLARIPSVYAALLASGVPASRLMIGGLEPLGGLQLVQHLRIDTQVDPGYVTLTVWPTTERVWPGNWPHGVRDAVREGLVYLKNSLAASGLRSEIVLVEAGWRTQEPGASSLQAAVLGGQLQAAADAGVQHVGLWAPIDSPGNGFGLLDMQGNPRQDVIDVWCSLAPH